MFRWGSRRSSESLLLVKTDEIEINNCRKFTFFNGMSWIIFNRKKNNTLIAYLYHIRPSDIWIIVSNWKVFQGIPCILELKKCSWSLEASLPLTHPCTEENTHRVEEIYRSSDVIWLPSLKLPFQYSRVTFQQEEDSPDIFCLMPNTPHHSQHLSN